MINSIIKLFVLLEFIALNDLTIKKHHVNAAMMCWSCDSRKSNYCPDTNFSAMYGIKKYCSTNQICGKEVFRGKNGSVVVKRGCMDLCVYYSDSVFCEVCSSNLCNQSVIPEQPQILFAFLSLLFVILFQL